MVAFAQDPTENAAVFNVDSLRKVLQSEKEDTSKVNTLHALAHKLYFLAEYDSCLKYIQSSLSLAKKLNYKRGQAAAYFLIGGVYSNLGNNAETLKNSVYRFHFFL